MSSRAPCVVAFIAVITGCSGAVGDGMDLGLSKRTDAEWADLGSSSGRDAGEADAESVADAASPDAGGAQDAQDTPDSGPIPTAGACSATAGPLTLRVRASRASGVAPLAVVFETLGTADTSYSSHATEAFHAVEYRWDFGDPSGDARGTTAWTTGTRTDAGSRNFASGPVAAHVFDPIPGAGDRTYTIRVTAFDGVSRAECALLVTAQDADQVFAGPHTTCVSASSLPVAGSGGCPSGAAVARQADWPTIVGNYLGTGRRVLLRGGEIYSGASNTSLAVTGPALIGAYGGSGQKAILRTTGLSGTIALLSGRISDLRLVDLDFDGQGVPSTSALASSAVSASQLLWYRVSIHHTAGGVDLEETQAASPPDGLAFVDSSVSFLNSDGSAGPVGLRLTGANVAVLGSAFNDSTAGSAEHLARLHWLDRAVVSNNRIENGHTAAPRGNKEMLSIRAIDSVSGHWGLTGEAVATKFVVVSENEIRTNTYAGVHVTLSGDLSDRGLFHDILIERNDIPVVAGGGYGIIVIGSRVTIRNNIIDLSSSSEPIGIWLYRASTGIGAPDHTEIYQNTIYCGAPTTSFVGVGLSAGSTGVIVRNNLAFAPNATGPLMVMDLGSSAPTISNNSADGSGPGSVRSNPGFRALPPVGAALSDWTPTCTTNYPCAAGAPIPVRSDFAYRSPPAARDLGAFSH